MAKEFSKAFYNSGAWQDTRDYILQRDNFLCIKCGQAAEEVHHKIFLTPQNINDPSITLNPDNLVSLCHDCHTQLHKEAEAPNGNVLPVYGFDEYGQLKKI